MTGTRDETPAERLARWKSEDAAIGRAAELEQLEAQLAEARREVADLRARLTQLTNRVAQVEADNAALRRIPGRALLARIARRLYRLARSTAHRLLRR